jgi:hypothetical protein
MLEQAHIELDAGRVNKNVGNGNGDRSSSQSRSRSRSGSNRGNHGSAQQLEQAMARMEVQIRELDQQLEALANDSAALEQTWNEREQLSAAYDELLAQWAEM